jgi:hypothetical protein
MISKCRGPLSPGGCFAPGQMDSQQSPPPPISSSPERTSSGSLKQKETVPSPPSFPRRCTRHQIAVTPVNAWQSLPATVSHSSSSSQGATNGAFSTDSYEQILGFDFDIASTLTEEKQKLRGTNNRRCTPSKLLKVAPSPVTTNIQDEKQTEDSVNFKWSKKIEFEGARHLLLWAFIASFPDQQKREMASISLSRSTNSVKEAKDNEFNEEDVVDDILYKSSEELEDIVLDAVTDKKRQKLLEPFFQSDTASHGNIETAIRLMCKADPDICTYILQTICPNALFKDISKDKMDVMRKKVMGTALELFAGLALKYRKATLRDYIKEEYLEKLGRYQGSDIAVGPIHVNCQVEGCYISGAPKCSIFHMVEKDNKRLREALLKQAQAVRAAPETANELADTLIMHMKNDKAFDLLIWLREFANPSKKNHFYLVQCKARADPEVDRVDVRKYISDATALQRLASQLDSLTPLLFCSTVSSYRPFLEAFNGSYQHLVSRGYVVPWLLPDICNDDEEQDLFCKVFLDAMNIDLLSETPDNTKGIAVQPKPIAKQPLPPPQSYRPIEAAVRQQKTVLRSIRRIVATVPLPPPLTAYRTATKPLKAPKPVVHKYGMATKPLRTPLASVRSVPPAARHHAALQHPNIKDGGSRPRPPSLSVQIVAEHKAKADFFGEWLADKKHRATDDAVKAIGEDASEDGSGYVSSDDE